MHALGPFRIPTPFVLAPMAGITNSAFRRLMKKSGAGLVISELVSSNGMLFGNQKTYDLLKFHEEERPVGLQIFGERPDVLAEASRRIEELGADFVDLNLGCPVPKVVKKGGGSAMCRNLPLLYEVLSGMKKAVNIPVTIKIRTGWDSQSINALEVVRVAEDAGVSWVAIHGRSRAQAYSGEADWDLIGDVKAKAKIPIIGNGDVLTADRAIEVWKKYGVDAVMIGRGVLRNPFLFRQIKSRLNSESEFQAQKEDFIHLLETQRRLLLETESSRVASIQSKKFLAWYAAGYPGCHQFRKNLFQTNGFDQVWEEARQFFEARLHERSLDYLAQPFLMGGHG